MKKKYKNTKWKMAGTTKKEYKSIYSKFRQKAYTLLKKKYREEYRLILRDLINKEFNDRIEKERIKILSKELK